MSVLLCASACVRCAPVCTCDESAGGGALRQRISEHANFAVHMREATWRAQHNWDEKKAVPEAVQQIIKKHRQAGARTNPCRAPLAREASVALAHVGDIPAQLWGKFMGWLPMDFKAGEVVEAIVPREVPASFPTDEAQRRHVLAQVVTAGTLRGCSDASVRHFLALLTPDYAAPLKDRARKILTALADDVSQAVDARLASGGPWCIVSDGAHSKSHSFVNVGHFVGGWPSRG